MPRVTITIDSASDGSTMRVMCNPSFEELMRIAKETPDKFTRAHGCAAFAMQKIFELVKQIEKEGDHSHGLILPEHHGKPIA